MKLAVRAVVLGLVTSTLLVAAPVSAGGGNSDQAKACQNDGWQWFARDDRSTFANQGQCVSYGARGYTLQGTLPPGCYVNEMLLLSVEWPGGLDDQRAHVHFGSGNCTGGNQADALLIVDTFDAWSRCASGTTTAISPLTHLPTGRSADPYIFLICVG